MTVAFSRVAAVGRQVILTGGAVVGTVCILLAFAAVTFGVRPLVFESGSMSPTIDTGALAISREVPASALDVGQVVSVPTSSGHRVTHRIVAVTHQAGTAILVLRGDANPVADQTPYPVTHADRVLFDVPRLGYVVGWLTGPLGLFVLGLYAAFLLSVVLRGAPREPQPGSGPTRRGSSRPWRWGRAPAGKRAARGRAGREPVSRALGVLLIAGVVSGLVLPLHSSTTLAAWVDAPVQVTGTRLTAYTVPHPEGPCEVGPGDIRTRSVRFTWSDTAAFLPALGYDTSVSGLTGATSTLTSDGGTEVLVVEYVPSDTDNQNAVATVRATAHLLSTTSWVSTVKTWTFTTGHKKQDPATCGS